MVQRAFSHDLGGSRGVSPMNEKYLRGKTRQKDCFFGGRVAAANNRDWYISVKGPVASRTRGKSMALQLVCIFQSEPLGGCSAGNDQRLSLDPFTINVDRVMAVNRFEPMHL